MSSIVINPYSHGGVVYNRTPLKVLKAIPAGFPLPLHDVMFGVAGHSDEIFDNIQSAGEDLRAFSDEAMTTELPLEIISITPGSDELLGYVRIASAMSINDKIYLRTTIAGGESAPAADSTYGSEAVWQDYTFVCHGDALNVDAAGNKTSGSHTGGAQETGAALLNRWPARGYGANEGAGSTDKTTLIAGGDDGAIADEMVVCYKNGTEGDTNGNIVQWRGTNLDLHKTTTDEIIWERGASTQNQMLTTTNGDLSDNAWHYLSMTWPTIGTAPTLRIDGGAPTSPTTTGGSGTFNNPASDYVIGNAYNGAKPADCRIAEVRYRQDNTPDAAWKDLEWDGFNDPGALAEAEAMVTV